MARRTPAILRILAAVVALVAPGCGTLDGLPAIRELLAPAAVGAELDDGTVVAGLKEALRVGAKQAVDRTSRPDGFLHDARIRIPLPESIRPMADLFRSLGLGGQIDELELAMNRAAERASGEALDVLVGAVRGMSFADARAILTGGNTAATDYFRGATEGELRQRFEPIVGQKMDEVGLVRVYDGLVGKYAAIPFKEKPSLNLRGYVTQKGLDGLFTVLADEEQKIREDPAARTTELLVKVFGR